MRKRFTIATRQDAEDFVRGCTFYGAGGGGDFAWGVDEIVKQLEKGNEVGWVDPDELDQDAYSCCSYLMGSIAPENPEAVREREIIYGLGAPEYDFTQAMVGAVRALEELRGRKISVLVPSELGGANSATCLCAAAELGIAAVDGDYSGRAVPEIQQTTPFIFEKELLPIVTFDCWGNMASINKTVNWRMAERIGKMIADAGYSKCAQAGFCYSVREMKEALIHGTLTECYEVGKALRLAVEEGRDPAEAAAEKVGGYIVCRGTVVKKEWWDKIGYYWGYHTIQGEDDFRGTEVKIWFKNENHVSWRNGEPFVSSPDILQLIDGKTGMPLTNNKVKEGMSVAIIAMKGRDVFRSERGLVVLSPKAFGFDIPYRSVESILGE